MNKIKTGLLFLFSTLFFIFFVFYPSDVSAINTFKCQWNISGGIGRCIPNPIDGNSCATGYTLDPNLCTPLNQSNCASPTNNCIKTNSIVVKTCATNDCGAVNQSCYNDDTCNSGLTCKTDTSAPIPMKRCFTTTLDDAAEAVKDTLSTGPIPNPPVACNETRTNEFQSLRPYQASATCKSETASYASFCGNDITIKDSITVNYSPGQDCKTSGEVTTCNYTIPVNKTVTMNLSEATLPIMGNTENTINYKNKEDEIDDATKLSEYVSWYLGGVTNKKEYPDKTDDISIINFSGPLAKLIPQDIQNYERFKQIAQAKTSRHNQVVVCAKKEIDNNLIPKSFKWALEHLGFGQTVAAECPDGEEMRLTDWDGNLSIVRDIQNAGVSLVDVFLKMVPWINDSVVEQAVSNNKAWPYRTPPVSWGVDPDGDPFTELTFQKAYNEWRGKSCILIPFPQLLICTEDFLVPNSYAEMYQYIPLSSTEDVTGKIAVDRYSTASTASPGVVLSEVGFSNQSGTGQATSTLFFPHLEESDQLGSLLQDTYAPKGVNKVAQSTDISNDLSCKEIEVRSNAGDNLFASQIKGNLSYTATFSCAYNLTTTTDEVCLKTCLVRALDPSTCNKTCQRTNSTSCTKDVYVKLSTTTSTPKIDDIWTRLVAGSMSVFKRIFPKTNTEGSVGQIMDIAGSTNITYEGDGISQSNTDLKIPHVGGISEYFLKGIQTALRPKGFGSPISFDLSNNIESPISGNVDCDQGAADVSSLAPKLISKEKLHQLAIDFEGVEGDHVLECYNDVVRKSIDAGVSPAFTLMLWINESGGSNYSISKQDFGINSSAFMGFTAQINQFLTRPAYYKQDSRWSSCFGIGKDDEMFFSVYYYGWCDPNVTPPKAQEYIDLVNTHWNTYTNCNYPGYPFEDNCH